jgi:hypothetical protein
MTSKNGLIKSLTSYYKSNLECSKINSKKKNKDIIAQKKKKKMI